MDVQTDGRGEPGQEAKPPGSIYPRLPEAFAYPFRGLGWATIAAGAVLFWVFKFLMALPVYGYYVVFKWLLWGIVGGYVSAYMMKIIGSSAAGRDEPPEWPDFTSFWDDIFRPLLLLIGAGLFSFLPLIVRMLVASWSGAADNGCPGDELYWICLGWGMLYLPMGLTAVALFDSLEGLNPLLVMGAMVKTLPAYLLAVAMFFVLYWMVGSVQESISEAVPVIGPLIAGAVALYFLMVGMRIVGLLYNAHAKRLGWFEE